MCRVCFLSLYHISHKMYYAMRAKFNSGVVAPGNVKTKHNHREPYILALTWLKNYGDLHSDKMPNQEIYELPFSYSKTMVYEKYREDSTKPIGEKTFLKLWTDHFKHLTIKEVSQ